MIQPLAALKWPDLNAIRVNEKEKQLIETFIEKVRCEPSPTHFKNFCKHDNILELPISLCFLYDEKKQIKHIILLLNKSRGKQFIGGQRQPKLAYDLFTGMYCIKKQQSHQEGTIVDYLERKPQEHLVKILGKRELKGKTQYFETAYDGTLHTWVTKPRLHGYHNKLLIMRKLLLALHNFEKIKISRIHQDVIFNHSSFHNDVKLENILVNNDNDVALTDFGLSNILHNLGCSPYYAHPIKILMIKWSSTDLAQYQARLGGRLDMWSLGIVFVVILTNRVNEKRLPTLTFLDDLFNRRKEVKVAVTQQRITDELLELRKQTESLYSGKVLNPLWDLVIDMLQMDPEKIPTVDQALERVEGLMRDSTLALGGCLRVVKRCDELKKELEETIRKIKNLS